MPGKRYDLRITHGPFKGCRARLIAQAQSNPQEFALSALTGYRKTTTLILKPDHFRRIPATRPHRRRRPR